LNDHGDHRDDDRQPGPESPGTHATA
jgi:hypothetical protein